MRVHRFTAAVLLALPVALLAQSEGVGEFKGQTTVGPGQTMPSQAKIYTARPGVRVEMRIDTQNAVRSKEARGAVPAEMRMLMISRVSEPDRVYFVNEEAKTYSVINSKEAAKEAAKTTPRESTRSESSAATRSRGFPARRRP